MESTGIVLNIPFFLNVLSGIRLARKFYLKQHLVLAIHWKIYKEKTDVHSPKP